MGIHANNDEIDFLNEKETINLINSFPKERIVFWIGAGIDMDPPTSLPSGAGLTRAILQIHGMAVEEDSLAVGKN